MSNRGGVAPVEGQRDTVRRKTVEELFIGNYSGLSTALYEALPTLNVFDHDSVMDYLQRELSSYDGPLDDSAFREWAIKLSRTDAERYVITEQLLRDYRAVIYAAIFSALHANAQDCSIDAEDVFSEISLLVFRYAHSLKKAGTARLSTRLHSLTKRHTLSYHTNKRNRRYRVLKKRLQEGDEIRCEVVSPDEISASESASCS